MVFEVAEGSEEGEVEVGVAKGSVDGDLKGLA